MLRATQLKQTTAPSSARSVLYPHPSPVPRLHATLPVMWRSLTLTSLAAAAVAYTDALGLRWYAVAALAIVVAALALKVARFVRRRAARRSVAGLRLLPPGDFEAEVARWLRRDGWHVELRGGTGDGGIDLIAQRGAEALAVQCKRYAESAAVSAAQVRDLYGAAIANGSTRAVLVTTGRVSSAARTWCEALPAGTPVHLFDAEELGAVAAGRAAFSHAWR